MSSSTDQLWLFRRADGMLCRWVQRLPIALDHDDDVYLCEDESILLGPVKAARPMWRLQRVLSFRKNASGEVKVVKSETINVLEAWQPR